MPRRISVSMPRAAVFSSVARFSSNATWALYLSQFTMGARLLAPRARRAARREGARDGAAVALAAVDPPPPPEPFSMGFPHETPEQLAARLAAYKRDGYTLWRGLYSAETMLRWREEQCRLQAESASLPGATSETTWFGNMLERSPQV